MNNSLFLKLYLSIGVVIVASIVLMSVALDFYDNSGGDVDFVADVRLVAAQLNSEDQGDTMWQVKAHIASNLSNFAISTLSTGQYHAFETTAELIEKRPDLSVYEMDDGRLGALFKYQHRVVLIADKADLNERQDKEDYEALGLLALIFASIGLVLSLSVKSIAKQVQQLSQASLALAQGKLDTRVSQSIPAPLNQMATSFNTMAESLQSARNQQQIMANAIAHELRTPLTRIQLALGLLSEEHHSDYSARLHQDINSYALEMESLANDILTLQKLEVSCVVESERFDLRRLIEQSVVTFSSLFAEQTINIELIELSVQANCRYYQLIVDNLIKNACLYAHSQVQIQLTQNGNVHQLVVEDDGPGIPAKMRQQVLAPFNRLDNSRSRQTGGFGLGLAIVNASVKQLNAQLHISTSSLGGARFVIEVKG